jgi:hypothetical protein
MQGEGGGEKEHPSAAKESHLSSLKSVKKLVEIVNINPNKVI